MAYVIDPTNPASPADTDPAASGAGEFRALKGYIQGLISGGASFTSYAWQGFRNLVLNGNYDIWQDQTSLGSGTGKRYYADGHYLESVGTTYSQAQVPFTVGQTLVPNNPTWYDQIQPVSVAGAGNYCRKVIPIERGTRNTAGRTCTYTFWAFADAVKNIAVELVQNFGTGGSPSADVVGIGTATRTLSTGFQKFTIQYTLPSVTGKTFGTNNDDILYLIIWMDAGSTFNSRTNTLGQQSGVFRFSQHQFEIGGTDTPFELRPIDFEFDWALRYYKVTGGTTSFPYGVGQVFATTNAIISVPYKRMWKNPALAISAVTDFAVLNASGSAVVLNAMSLYSVTVDLAFVSVGTAGGLTGGNATVLQSNGANSKLKFDARI